MQPNDLPGGARISRIETLISKKSYNEARREIASLIELTLEGLRYLETLVLSVVLNEVLVIDKLYSYDRTLIRIIVTTGYIGWAVYNAFLILPNFQGLEFLYDVKPSAISFWIIRVISMGVFALMSVFFVMHHSPITYYGYIAFPLFFWSEILIRAQAYYGKIQKEKVQFERFSTSLVIKGMTTILALLAMVVSLRNSGSSNIISSQFIGGIYASTSLEHRLHHFAVTRYSQKRRGKIGTCSSLDYMAVMVYILYCDCYIPTFKRREGRSS